MKIRKPNLAPQDIVCIGKDGDCELNKAINENLDKDESGSAFEIDINKVVGILKGI